jgi:hypothetical protein
MSVTVLVHNRHVEGSRGLAASGRGRGAALLNEEQKEAEAVCGSSSHWWRLTQQLATPRRNFCACYRLAEPGNMPAAAAANALPLQLLQIAALLTAAAPPLCPASQTEWGQCTRGTPAERQVTISRQRSRQHNRQSNDLRAHVRKGVTYGQSCVCADEYGEGKDNKWHTRFNY